MRSDAKASSAGSTMGQGISLGSFVRGAFAIRGGSGGADGSGARLIGAIGLLAVCLLLTLTGTAVAAEPPTLIPNSATPLTFDSVEVDGEAEVHGGETLYVVIQVLASEEGNVVGSEFIQTIAEGETGTVPINGVIHRLDANTHYYVRLFVETAAEERFTSPKPYLQVTTPAEPPLAPRVSDEEVASVTGTEAVLNAQVTPERSETTYRFEYIPREAFGPEEWASPAVQKSGVLGPLPADGNKHVVSYQLQGLSPGVSYLWRATAENAVGQGEGPTFAVGTYGPTPTFGSCPNSAFRVGLGAELPDCRAYEQATPTDKGGLNVQGFADFLRASSDSGDPRVAFVDPSGSGIPAGDGGRQDLTPLLSSKQGGSWSTQRLFPPESLASEALVRGMSANLRFSLDEVNMSPAGSAQSVGLSLIDTASGEITPVVPGQAELTAERSFSSDAVANDGSFVFFETEAVLATGARASRTNLYKWDRATDSIATVGILPSGEPVGGDQTPPAGAFGGAYNWPNGNTSAGGASAGQYVEAIHAAAPNGDQIYFTAAETGQIYLRRGLNGPSPTTIRVSEANAGVVDPVVEELYFGEPLPAAFQEATPDGSRAFFTSQQKLTADAATGPEDGGRDLYVFDAATEELSDVTGGLEGPANPNGAEVVGLLGASVDGTAGYFVANGDLGGDASPGLLNVYRFEEEAAGSFHLTFVATLSNKVQDRDNWSVHTFNGLAESGSATSKSSRVSNDADELVFSSTASLTGYNNGGCGSVAAHNEACTEIYLYSAPGEDLACISCDPTGQKPLGDAALTANYLNISTLVSTFPPASYLTRNISADGNRIFFQTPDSLVQRDENGRPNCKYLKHSGPLDLPSCVDVYEWEAVGTPGGSCAKAESNGGCLYLLSAGNSADPSNFIDASADGSNVFIATNSPLVPTDRDDLFDIYNVRTVGGLASQFALPRPPCEGEACRSSAAAPTPQSSPGSASFVGPGNSKVKPRKSCQKGKSCKRHHKKHQRKKKAHKKHGRAGSSKGGQK